MFYYKTAGQAYQEIKFGLFPNQESYADLNLSVAPLEILFKFQNDGDLIKPKFLKDYLDERRQPATLVIPYFPYERMDRQEEQRLFTLKSVCQFINSLHFETVTIWEPHSEVVVALLDHVQVVDKTKELTLQILAELTDLALTTSAGKILAAAAQKDIYLLYPDAGAVKRYSKQIAYTKVIEGSKERDFMTGRIKKFHLFSASPIAKERTVLILDDLCSRGGTFQLAGAALREQFAFANVYLVVTHCEETIHQGEVLTGNLIDRVYTTTSLLTPLTHPKLHLELI